MTNNYTVYKHTSPHGKVYIGITSQSPIRRWRKDGSGYKSHTHFYRAIKKYGWDNFKHEILFSGLSQKEAEQKEMELIALYNSTNQDYGYNISLGGKSGSFGYRFSKEQKIQLSKLRKGKNNGMYGKNHTKEANEKNRIAHMKENLSEDTIHKMSIAKKGKKRTKQSIEKQRQTISHKVVCLETMVEYNGTKEAGRINNIDPSTISKVCRGERKTAGQLHWCYR